MDIMKQIDFWVSFLASLFTISASGLAIYIYVVNKDKISTAFNLLLNYSKQLTLSELKFKIERLNDFTTNETEQKKEVINILSEIEGQIIGNKKIKSELEPQSEKIKSFLENSRTLTEPKKRSLVSELRESVRNIDISNYQNIIK
tara:strand:+ start:2949 stop:3383 length:435 start_codon:yes stop_codon:yes gene_type:complete